MILTGRVFGKGSTALGGGEKQTAYLYVKSHRPIHCDYWLLAMRSEEAEMASVMVTSVSSVRINGTHKGT